MSRRWPARRVRLRWCRYQPASGGLPQLARRTLLPGSNPEGRPTLRLQGRSLYATCRLNGPFGSPRSSIALDVTRRAGLAFAHGKIYASHCIGLPGNGGVKHWGLNFRSTSHQLAALIQQRLRHVYRRQRPTPTRELPFHRVDDGWSGVRCAAEPAAAACLALGSHEAAAGGALGMVARAQ
jgi:hypothetical protein